MVFHRSQAREIEKEISFTPGRLANKLGIGKSTLKKHLEDSGLIEECFYDDHGWLRIPYSTACKMATPEAVAIKRERRPRERTTSKRDLVARLHKQTERFDEEESKVSTRISDEKERCEQLARMLIKSGLTVKDVLNLQPKGQSEDTESDSEGRKKSPSDA